jgi:hypothetical protein
MLVFKVTGVYNITYMSAPELRFCDFLNIFLCDANGEDDDMRDRLIRALPLDHLRSVAVLHSMVAPSIRFDLSTLVFGMMTMMSNWDLCDHRFGAGMAKHPLLAAVCDVLDIASRNREFVAEVMAEMPRYLEGWVEQTLVGRLYAHGVRNLVAGKCLCRLHIPLKRSAPAPDPPAEPGHWLVPFGRDVSARNEHLCGIERGVSGAARLFDFLRPVLDLSGEGGLRLVVAGGSVRDALAYAPISDYDLFLVGGHSRDRRDTAKALEVVEMAVRVLVLTHLHSVDNLVVVLTDHVVTVCMHDEEESTCTVVQLVLRWFDSIENLLCNFDMDACKYAWDGRDFWTTDMAEHARRSRTVLVDPAQHSTPRRLLRYARKGYRVIVPTTEKTVTAARVCVAQNSTRPEALRALEARGGLVGSLALCQRNLMTVTPPHSDPQCVISHVYGYAECAPRLMLSEHRERFLSQNSRYRVYCLSQAQKDDMDVDAAMAVLFPEELRELLLGTTSYWHLKQPEIRNRLGQTEDFYDVPTETSFCTSSATPQNKDV